MTDNPTENRSGNVIATIENRENPEQNIDLVYLPEENGFATSGIRRNFDLPEILIPTHMVAKDLNLMGAIVSTILEKISKACEEDAAFAYSSKFHVLDQEYTLTPHGDFVKLETPITAPEFHGVTDN